MYSITFSCVCVCVYNVFLFIYIFIYLLIYHTPYLHIYHCNVVLRCQIKRVITDSRFHGRESGSWATDGSTVVGEGGPPCLQCGGGSGRAPPRGSQRRWKRLRQGSTQGLPKEVEIQAGLHPGAPGSHRCLFSLGDGLFSTTFSVCLSLHHSCLCSSRLYFPCTPII